MSCLYIPYNFVFTIVSIENARLHAQFVTVNLQTCKLVTGKYYNNFKRLHKSTYCVDTVSLSDDFRVVEFVRNEFKKFNISS